MPTRTLDSMNADMLNVKEVSKSNATSGRRGDPRMHRAVNARCANPSISLLEALIIGGFEFPNDTKPRHDTETGEHKSGKSTQKVYDSDNVLLSQRKNQLSRRLRLARKRSCKIKQNAESSTRKINHLSQESGNDSFLSSLATATATALYRDRAPKRRFSYHNNHDEQTTSTRLKISNDVTSTNVFSFSSFDTASPQPESLLLALLQKNQLHQQRISLHHILEQIQARTTLSSYSPLRHQGLEQDFFLQNQISLNNVGSRGGGLFKQFENKNHIQNTTQNKLDQEYLKKRIAKSAIRSENQRFISLPQENKIQANYQSCDQNQSQSQFLQLLHKYDLLDNMDPQNTHIVSQIQQEDEKNLERAAYILDLKRSSLIQRYLTLLPPGRPIG